MQSLMEMIGPLTVSQRVIIGVVGAIAVFAVLIGVTAIFTRLWRAALIWGVLVAVAVAVLAFAPVNTAGLGPNPDPAADFEAAVARFAAERAAIVEPLNPLCEPQLLTHEKKTARVVVLMHGVSSCPQAFVDFAPILFERGDNVLTVLMPQNGFADTGTDALRHLTAEQLRDFADTSVDIAAGLGDEVVVLGISAGGTAAAWAAQNRSDVDRAVLIAPFFGLGGTGPQINDLIMKAMLWLPDFSIWKDPSLREAWNAMPHAYARQSTRATGEIMRLGRAVYREAGAQKAAAGEIALILNDADTAVSNSVTEAVAERWDATGTPVTRYVFDESHALGHELIDPLEPGANPELTYPIILQMIDDPSNVEGATAAQ